MEADHAWLLTPPGPGAIAVIRMSGAGVSAFLRRHFGKPTLPGICVHGELRDELNAVIDDPVVVALHEQTADLNLHGGGAVIRAVMSLADRNGFKLEKPADPLQPDSDIVNSEMHAALHLPTTRLGLNLLLAQPRAWAATKWTPALAAAALEDRSLGWLLHPPTIALIGQANVGKSTLANRLFGQDRSIVFDQPGTTRDYVRDLADLDGLPVHLVDTPGQRETSDPIEARAIELSLQQIKAADLRILLLDRTQPANEQRPLIDRYPDALCVTNKLDQPAIWSTPSEISICAETADGVAELIQGIRSRFITNDLAEMPRCWTDRQRYFLRLLQSCPG